MPETGNKVSFDTAKTVLVPVELYERGEETEYLRFNGMALTAGEIAVASEPQGGMLAIMGISAEVWEHYRREYERGGVVVTSPLFTRAAGRTRRGGRDVDILLTSENVYLAVRDGDLCMAEAMPDNSVDSLLYYIQILGQRFKLKKFDINVGGEKAGIVADALRRYYKRVKVVK